MSKSGKLGYVASFPVPSVFSGTNAFLMGARSVNPNATMQAIIINSWFDPQAATQAGTALIDNGCDFLFGIMDEAGYLQVAEQRGVKAVDVEHRHPPLRPEGLRLLDRHRLEEISMSSRCACASRASGRRRETLLPMGGGIDRDAWGETVPPEVAKQADAVRDKMLGGWSPFEGEIKDAKGNVKVAAGERMTEEELYNWDWSIEGVSGL